MKLAFVIFLMFAAFSTERINDETSQQKQKKLEEHSQKQLRNVCSNESSVKLFHDMEANELIFWEDPNDLIRNDKKEEIESFLQLEEGEARSNGLFDCISNWSPPRETRPFVKELMFFLSENVNVDKRGEKFNETLLMIAAGLDAENTVAKLIERGARMEAIDKNGFTALHYAAKGGNKSSCEILLQKKANVNAQTKHRSTPLMFAAGMSHCEVVQLLLESGAHTGIPDEHGKIAFDYAKPNCADIIKAHEYSQKKLVVEYDGHSYDGPQLEFYFKVKTIY